jgi:hypothetical protein
MAEILLCVAAKHLAFMAADGTFHHGFLAHGCFRHRLGLRHSVRLLHF